MNFSEVQQSVQQAWEFTWPPVILLAIMIGLVRFLAPSFYETIRNRLSIEAPSRWSRARATLHHLGISKLLPVISLFLIVFTLFLTNSVIHLVGNSIPPRISYRPDIIFARTVDEKQLACLWSFFPWTDIETLSRVVNRRIESEDKIDSGVKNWRTSLNQDYSRFDATKFLVLWALLCWVTGRRFGQPQNARLVKALAVLSFAAMFYLFGFLYALEQWQYAQRDAAIALWINKKSCIDAAGQPLALTPEQNVQWDREKAGGRGWRVEVPFKSYWSWVRKM